MRGDVFRRKYNVAIRVRHVLYYSGVPVAEKRDTMYARVVGKGCERPSKRGRRQKGRGKL